MQHSVFCALYTVTVRNDNYDLYIYSYQTTLHPFSTFGPFVAWLILAHFGTGYFETSC